MESTQDKQECSGEEEHCSHSQRPEEGNESFALNRKWPNRKSKEGSSDKEGNVADTLVNILVGFYLGFSYGLERDVRSSDGVEAKEEVENLLVR